QCVRLAWFPLPSRERVRAPLPRSYLTRKCRGAELLRILEAKKIMVKDALERELIKRSPMAACVLDMSSYIFSDQLLKSIWDEHRGRCYEDVLNFSTMIGLMRDALICHGGSAHKLFLELESREEEPVDESNFYRKLARTPVQISRAMLSDCTQHLCELLP